MITRLPPPRGTIIPITVGALLVAAVPALAQKLSIDVGPIGGTTIANWRGADVGPSRPRSSFVVGASITVRFGRHFALQPEVLYLRKGTELIIAPCGPAASCSPTADYQQNYLELPLLLTATYPMGSRMPLAPTVFAGPAVAFQTSCVFSEPPSSPIGPQVPTREPCDSLYTRSGTYMKHTDALMIFGGGFSIGPLALRARYDLGLTKLFANSLRSDIKSEAWLVTAGFRLQLGRPQPTNAIRRAR